MQRTALVLRNILELCFFFFNIGAGGELCVVGVVYGDEEDAIAGIPAQDKAFLKSEKRQIRRPTVEKDVVQQVELCFGWPRSLGVSMSWNTHFQNC